MSVAPAVVRCALRGQAYLVNQPCGVETVSFRRTNGIHGEEFRKASLLATNHLSRHFFNTLEIRKHSARIADHMSKAI